MEPSPALEGFFDLMKRVYLRLEAEGKWDEALAAVRAEREVQERIKYVWGCLRYSEHDDRQSF